MEFEGFYHPDISWPVVRRQAGDELLTLVAGFGEAILTRGRSLDWDQGFSSRRAYHSSASRLRKAGLITSRDGRTGEPKLRLTDQGIDSVPRAMHPERYWRRRWSGRWYVLMYDVPESNKKYREMLRRFLARMRMGCLQKSVWVTPDDIRPEYHDLTEAAAVSQYSFLLESRLVLGRSHREIVESAWPFDLLWKRQHHFCEVCRHNMDRLTRGIASKSELTQFARWMTEAYLSAMAEDPLLPDALLPELYRGKEAFRFYNKLRNAICRQL